DLELGALVREMGILDGEVMQPEPLLHPLQQGLIRLMQPDPDEALAARRRAADLLEVDVGDAAAALVGGTGDNVVHLRFRGAGGGMWSTLRVDCRPEKTNNKLRNRAAGTHPRGRSLARPCSSSAGTAGGRLSLSACSWPAADILFQVLARMPGSLSWSVLPMNSPRECARKTRQATSS